MLIGSLLLVSLAIFIVWDSRRLRSTRIDPLSRERMEKGVNPGADIRWKAMLGIAVMVGSIGVSD